MVGDRGNYYPREPKLIAATVVVAFVLALSRWGTNIGVMPLFISDVLIAFAFFHMLASRGRSRPSPRKNKVIGKATPLFIAFFGYFLLRFLTSVGQWPVLDWLRDGVPFAYGILAFMSAYSIARSSERTRAATVRLFRWALTIHLLWVAAVSLTGNTDGFNVLGPFAQAPFFQIRPDIDVALMAVAAAMSLRQVLLGKRRFWNVAGLALALLVVFGTLGTRAGQISFILALAATYAFTYAASHQARGRQMLMILLAPTIFVGGLLILPLTEGGQRIVATVAPSLSEESDSQAGALGTQRARELVWNGVIEWTQLEPARAVFGSGFGNDFLEQSGTLSYLEGTTYTGVRSPHNWFVGVYARLGVVGLALAALWVAELGRILWLRRHAVGHDDLTAIAAAVVIAILPVATFGVVLEAPFGAIPFFWAAGILMAERRPKLRAGNQLTQVVELRPQPLAMRTD
jgi:hypothetical protein